MKLNFNIEQYVEDYIPPSLRKPVRLAWLDALTAPVRQMWEEYRYFRDEARYAAAVTGQKIVLEAYLNRLFDPMLKRIYLRTGIDAGAWVAYTRDLKIVNTSNGYYQSQAPSLLDKDNISFEIYFKVTLSQTDAQYVFNIYGGAATSGIALSIDPSLGLRLYIGGGVASSPSVTDQQNIHLVITRDATTNENIAYFNGTRYSSRTANIANAITWFILGAVEPRSTRFRFLGNLYHARLFNKTLSSQEVEELYNNGSPADYVVEDKSILNGEFLPSGVSSKGWIDSSGNDANLLVYGSPEVYTKYSGDPDYFIQDGQGVGPKNQQSGDFGYDFIIEIPASVDPDAVRSIVSKYAIVGARFDVNTNTATRAINK